MCLPILSSSPELSCQLPLCLTICQTLHVVGSLLCILGTRSTMRSLLSGFEAVNAYFLPKLNNWTTPPPPESMRRPTEPFWSLPPDSLDWLPAAQQAKTSIPLTSRHPGRCIGKLQKARVHATCSACAALHVSRTQTAVGSIYLIRSIPIFRRRCLQWLSFVFSYCFHLAAWQDYVVLCREWMQFQKI